MLERTNYVVRVNSCPLWPNYKAATLAMCMGNANWQGEKFLTVLEWAARNFEFIRIDLSDSLGRHNDMAFGLSEKEALEKNLQMGREWRDEHEAYLKLCGRPYSLIHWDHWRNHTDYEATHTAFEAAVISNPKLAAAVDADISTYANRLRNRGEDIPEAWSETCRNYLIEELTGITLQARDTATAGGYRTTRVYPSDEPQSSRLVRANEINEAPHGLSNEYYTAININHRKTAVAAFAA